MTARESDGQVVRGREKGKIRKWREEAKRRFVSGHAERRKEKEKEKVLIGCKNGGRKRWIA